MHKEKDYSQLPVGIIEMNQFGIISYVNPIITEWINFKSYDNINFSDLFEFHSIQNRENITEEIFKCITNSKNKVFNKSALLKINDNELILIFITSTISKNNEISIVFTDISKEFDCKNIIGKTNYTEGNALHRIIGKDDSILELRRLISLASESLATVLITGESGTGKELVCNAIHQISERNKKPLIKVNCAALSESLLESELFGHIKGSFTGALHDKQGKFEAANGGTIFLDEIGEISQSLQVKLLRVLQEKTITRVGDNKEVKVDIRIITATNKNLRQLVSKGLFREDLFYRLHVFPIKTIPLREHKNDILLLANYFIEKFNDMYNKNIKGFDEEAIRVMMDYCWPGNVREMENAIEHAFVLCKQGLIGLFDLPQDIRLVSLRKGLCKGIDQTNAPTYFVDNEVPRLKKIKTSEISKEELESILESNKGNRNATALQLGISRVALWKKMKKYGLV